nr:uncharacterized mitochondrial protein AtMg00810-like [Tanacetum cinerariifolium]
MMGELKFSLGIQIHQSPRGIFINQAKYAQKILIKHGMTSCNGIGTPMATKHLDADLSGTPVDQTKYHSKVGALMYLTTSRPDIMHAICYCARYQAQPTKKHLTAVKRIFRPDDSPGAVRRLPGPWIMLPTKKNRLEGDPRPEPRDSPSDGQVRIDVGQPFIGFGPLGLAQSGLYANIGQIRMLDFATGESSKGKAKIAWKNVCKPKIHGELGLKDLICWNKALLGKHIWNIANKKGNGRCTLMWYDNWSGMGPLINYITYRNLYNAGMDRNCSVSDMIDNGSWKWPRDWTRMMGLKVKRSDVVCLATAKWNVKMNFKVSDKGPSRESTLYLGVT